MNEELAWKKCFMDKLSTFMIDLASQSDTTSLRVSIRDRMKVRSQLD